VLLVDVTHPDSEVSRLIHEAGHLNLHVEPGVRGGRHSFRFAKISTADTIHAEARGGNVLGATAEGPGPPGAALGRISSAAPSTASYPSP
jgi:hypothetical protein